MKVVILLYIAVGGRYRSLDHHYHRKTLQASFKRVDTARVTASVRPSKAFVGPHPFTIRCNSSVNAGETFYLLSVSVKYTNANSVILAEATPIDLPGKRIPFSINVPLSLKQRLTFSGNGIEKYLEARFNDTRCVDISSVFVCTLMYQNRVADHRLLVHDNVTLDGKVLPQPPEPMTATSGGRQVPQQVTDSTEVAYTCIANVGNFPPARITWFVSNTKASPGQSLTSKAATADQKLKPWDLECSVRRISVLRLSLTCQELGNRVYVRCHVDHPNKTIARCENPQQDFCRWSPPVDIKGCDLEVMPTVFPDNGESGATPLSPGNNAGGEEGAPIEYGDEDGQDGDSRASPAPRHNTKHKKTTAETDWWTLTLSLVIVGAVLGIAVTVILVSLLVRRAQRPAGGAPDSLVQQGVYTVSLQLQDDARTQYSGRTGESGGSGGSQYTASTEDTASVGTADTESVITDNTASDVDSVR